LIGRVTAAYERGGGERPYHGSSEAHAC
jgi:hypothetical protein